ncbi:MAG: twin-arginine translocase TatA/TatE family subunit [Flavobacteriaceae bacterium]|nr:twin-arginine translocase TatA/TatE family subunit [Flavobacteriaceae bacterium]
MFLFISGQEIVIIVIIAVMLFGADKIPEVARSLGKGMRQIKDATNDVKREISKSAKKGGIDTGFINDIKNEVKDVKKSVTDNFKDLTGPIKRKKT